MKYSSVWASLALFCIVVGGVGPAKSVAAPLASQTAATPQKIDLEPPSAEYQPVKPPESITLDWVLETVITRHPSLAATWFEIKSKQGAEQQAGLPPNPKIIGEIEEFGGSGDFSGSDVLSSRIGISQELPLGGKIQKRSREAKAQTDIAKLEHKAQLMELRAMVEERFYAVYTLQEKLRLQTEQFDSIKKTHEVVGKRVKAGDTSPLDLSRSHIELATVRIELEQIRQDLEAAQYPLAPSWGARIPSFSSVSAQYRLDPNLAEQELQESLQQSPSWLIQEAKLTHASAALELADAQRFPDIEVEGGVQRFNESEDHAFFFGITIPLPLFDRNQGAIAEAVALKRKTQYEMHTEWQVLEDELQTAWRKRVSAMQALQSFEEEVLPEAQQAYEALSKAYRAGEMDILALLDAQRTWVEARMARLDLLHDIESKAIEINRLVGRNEFYPVPSDRSMSQN